jgi:hypothetical protein
MRACLPLFVLLLASGSLRAEDDPKAIVERAIKAVGGEAVLARAGSCEMKIEGVIESDVRLPFHAVALVQMPDQFKHVMEYQRNGRTVTQVQMFHGNTIAIRIDNHPLGIDAGLQAALLRGRFADTLTQLTVLKAKEIQLTGLGESKVAGKPVVGVKVTAPGRPEVQVFFDRETGLLVKTEHRQLDPRTREDVVQEVYYRDYKVPDTTAADEKLLRAAGIGTAAADLLDFFRKRGKAGIGNRGKIIALIAQLGDDAFDRREQATTALIALGAEAVPLLTDALKNADLEVVRRAKHCLEKIGKVGGKTESPRLAGAAARLLAAKRPPGAAEALLEFLLAGRDEYSARETRAALARVAFRDSRPDKTLVDAADSKDAARRTAAQEALGRVPLPVGRKILLEGLKRPTTVVVYRAGRKFMEWHLTEITYFNKLDDKQFTTP